MVMFTILGLFSLASVNRKNPNLVNYENIDINDEIWNVKSR